MIAYVCLGTSDLERATAYYNALLAPMGGARFRPRRRAWSQRKRRWL